jgi:hypothetical protein
MSTLIYNEWTVGKVRNDAIAIFDSDRVSPPAVQCKEDRTRRWISGVMSAMKAVSE